VRDAAATLPACLESLRAQTFPDFEVLAVDDGSRDASRALLEAAARADPRLRVLETGGRGLVAALAAAAAAARGDLLARMDADDAAHPDRLRLQARRLDDDPGVDVLGCLVELVDGGDFQNQGMRAYVEWSNTLVGHDAIAGDILVESPLAHPSVMMRAGVYRGLGGYRAFDGPEDYDLWLRAWRTGRRFAKVPEVLLRWRDGPTRLSRTDPRYAAERFFDLKLHALLDATEAGDAFVVWGGGPIGKGWARALLARGRVVRAFVDVDPRRIGRTIHGAPVLASAEAARHRGAIHLAAVGSADARGRIREEAAALAIERVIAVA
jgi:glycosyltransferase involved in cell wall biosynthesis